MSSENTRNQNQIVAMSCLYEFLTRAEMGDKIDVKDLIERVSDTSYDQVDFFVREVVVKAIKNREEIIAALQANMKKWKFSRLNRITQAILLLAMAHFRFSGDIDRGAAIDVAVRLAKRYLDADDYKFVNAVLDHTL